MKRRFVQLALAWLILGSSAAWGQVHSDSQFSTPGLDSAPPAGPSRLPQAGPPLEMSVAPPPPEPALPGAAPARSGLSPTSTPWTPPPPPVPPAGAAETVVIPAAQSPHWVVSADALWLERTVGSSLPLGFTALNDGSHGPHDWPADALFTDDIFFPLESGVRLQIGARIGEERAVQLTYWGLQQWSIGRAIFGDPEGDTILAQSEWLQLPGLLGGLNDYLGYTYASRVDNAEINFRQRLNDFDPFTASNWLWGMRYFRLSDRFGLSGSDLTVGDYEDYVLRTSNNLVGPQIGIQWIRGWDRLQLTTEGKVGLLANFYTQRATDTAGGPLGPVPGFQPFDISHSGTGLSALFELSLLLTYRVSPRFWLRGGYQLYGVTGLALGPRQLEKFTHGGTVGLDGLSLGLEAAW
jgi:hypothetical protein